MITSKIAKRFGVWPFYSDECIDEVSRLMGKGGSLSAYRANPQVGVGPAQDSQVWKLERLIEKQFAVKHAIACNSGTAALHAALRAIGVKSPDDEVITSPFTFSATVSAILLAGGTPVFADIDRHSFCITAETIKNAITKKTKAILPVHLFGYFQDLTKIEAFGIPIVEDACQAVGARRGDSYSGTVGVAGCYSFNGTKNVPAGEGGAAVTNDDEVAVSIRKFINHAENFGDSSAGYNYRMQEVVACIARHGLVNLKSNNSARGQLAKYLDESRFFKGNLNVYRPIPDIDARQNEYVSNVFYVYPMVYKPRVPSRKEFCVRLRKIGVEVSEGYIKPILTFYPAFRRYYKPMPATEAFSKKTLCVFSQVRPPATFDDMDYIAKNIVKAQKA